MKNAIVPTKITSRNIYRNYRELPHRRRSPLAWLDVYNGGRDIWEMVIVCGAAFLWHFCHQRTRWIIQMAEAATWLQEWDLCLWSPEFGLIAGACPLGHESIKIEWLWRACYCRQKFESNLLCVKKVIFLATVCPQTGHTTSCLSQFTQMKRLLFFCVQQGPHRLQSL